MLKFLVFNFVLMIFISSWEVVEISLLMMCFLALLFSLNNDFFFFNLSLGMGVDFLGNILIMLSVWIVMLMVYASQGVKKTNNFYSMFLFVSLILLAVLLLTFCSTDYLMFYVSFESSLIPMLILILGWGYQPERIQAGIYMLFYTLFASLPLLVSLLSLYELMGSSNMGLMFSVSGSSLKILWYFCTIFAFLVKLPLYMFHLWLPKAHVEAPVAGSMILAGVLLKLGGYGLIRILMIFSDINKVFSWLWVSIGILGGVIVSLMCLRQVDMKSLIAYSSVAHMGLVLSGLIVGNVWGLNGAVVVMVGHGLCSSGLFCLANMVYERLGSRSLMIGKGLLNLMPNLGMWWFLLIVGNMAAPPTLNLLGEISLMISVVSWSEIGMIGISGLSFFSAVYTLYMYSLSQHGLFLNSLYSCCSGKVTEYFVLMMHSLPLNMVILKGTMVLTNF
uniref:NADH-ubiquinone oxidoreductase chain 4 n=1 Tax=Euastacus spinifer TaxID=99766 RepID=A0A0B4VKB6_9EUCA|nr:NADH dehydrogenase subunit 4 [Euastacus spinifer]AJD22596.1 NADH dehydrogenase subunit 4 [Euastacus spinifer]